MKVFCYPHMWANKFKIKYLCSIFEFQVGTYKTIIIAFYTHRTQFIVSYFFQSCWCPFCHKPLYNINSQNGIGLYLFLYLFTQICIKRVANWGKVHFTNIILNIIKYYSVRNNALSHVCYYKYSQYYTCFIGVVVECLAFLLYTINMMKFFPEYTLYTTLHYTYKMYI